jgi:hypothetical protein
VPLALGALVWANACSEETAVEIPAGPVEWSVSASSSSPEVQVGEGVVVTLTLTHPPEGDFVPPAHADFEPFDVLETWTEEVSPIETRLHFRLAAYQLPGAVDLEALAIRYRDDGGELATVETGPISVQVVSSLTPDVVDIHDIKDPVALEVPRDWGVLFWLLLALALTLAAYLIYRKLRKDTEGEAAPAWVAPPRPPHEEAEAALARLAERELIEKGELEVFYTELTDIMKRYAGRRFDVPYLERTTGEILSDLKARNASEGSLRAILEVADMVKFARERPNQDVARASLRMANELVQKTRPVQLEAIA